MIVVKLLISFMVFLCTAAAILAIINSATGFRYKKLDRVTDFLIMLFFKSLLVCCTLAIIGVAAVTIWATWTQM